MLWVITQHDVIFLVAPVLPAVTTGSSFRCPFGKPMIGSVEDSKVFQPHLTYFLLPQIQCLCKEPGLLDLEDDERTRYLGPGRACSSWDAEFAGMSVH